MQSSSRWLMTRMTFDVYLPSLRVALSSVVGEVINNLYIKKLNKFESFLCVHFLHEKSAARALKFQPRCPIPSTKNLNYRRCCRSVEINSNGRAGNGIIISPHIYIEISCVMVISCSVCDLSLWKSMKIDLDQNVCTSVWMSFSYH